MLEMLCCRNVLLLLLLSVTPPYDVLLGSGCVVSRAAEQRTTRLCTGYSIVSTRLSSHAGLLDRNTQTTIICLFGFISSSLYFAENFLKGEMHLSWCMNSTVVTVALGAAGSSRVSGRAGGCPPAGHDVCFSVLRLGFQMGHRDKKGMFK